MWIEFTKSSRIDVTVEIMEIEGSPDAVWSLHRKL